MSDYIKKLYELAKVNNASLILKEKWIGSTMKVDCEFIKPYNFTAEKQLELIKWLTKKTYRNYFKLLYSFGQKSWYMESDCISTPNMKNFENTLAGLVCKLWENLSEEQREEIKLILDTTKN